MDVDTISQTLQATKTVDNVYPKSFILEGELSSAQMQAFVDSNYGKIESAFVNFRNILKKKLAKKKASTKPKHV